MYTEKMEKRGGEPRKNIPNHGEGKMEGRLGKAFEKKDHTGGAPVKESGCMSWKGKR